MPILPPSASSDESLPPLPPFILALLLPWWNAFWSWIRTIHDHLLLARCRHHPLVRLAATIDFAPLEAACATYHHTTGPGAPPTHSVTVLLRAEFIRAWFAACSDRALEALLTEHALARWVCGLPFDAAAPDHTTLHRFHVWLVHHHPQMMFDTILAQLDRCDPLPTTVQLLDTFACHANAAAQHPVDLLAQLTHHIRRMLATLPPADATASLWPEPPPRQRLLTLAEVPAWIATSAADAAALLATLDATALPSAVAALLAPLRAALAHQLAVDFVCTADGTWRERPHGQKGSQRLGSAVDRDATFRKHGPSTVFGYNVALTTAQSRIRSIVVTTGCTADSATILPALEQIQQRGEDVPDSLVVDRAGGAGKVRAAVAAATNGHTQIVARLPSAGKAEGRFGPADFVLSSDGRSCRCPNGVTSTRRYASQSGEGTHFRWYAKDCQGCPLWNQCRDPAANPNGHRSVFLSAYHATVRGAAAFNATPEGQQLLRQRSAIEPVIADLVRNAGARQARCRGLKKVQFQLSMAATVVNLRRWLARCRKAASAARSGGSNEA